MENIEKELSVNNRNIIIAHESGCRVNHHGQVISRMGKFLTCRITSSGYLKFRFGINSKEIEVLVHKLQAYQKYGEAVFEPGIMVRHRNGISTDNSYVNILIGNALDNSLDRYKHRNPSRTKIASVLAKNFHRSDRSNFDPTKRFVKVDESLTSRFYQGYIAPEKPIEVIEKKLTQKELRIIKKENAPRYDIKAIKESYLKFGLITTMKLFEIGSTSLFYKIVKSAKDEEIIEKRRESSRYLEKHKGLMRHRWNGKYQGKLTTACIACGCIRETIAGQVTYFINDNVYFKAPKCIISE